MRLRYYAILCYLVLDPPFVLPLTLLMTLTFKQFHEDAKGIRLSVKYLNYTPLWVPHLQQLVAHPGRSKPDSRSIMQSLGVHFGMQRKTHMCGRLEPHPNGSTC